MKPLHYYLIFYSLVILILVSGCTQLYRVSVDPIAITGKTMGTSYHITYFDDERRNFSNQIDSLLMVVNKSISTYDSTSEVSRFNHAHRGIAFQLPYLYAPLKKSEDVFHESAGAFDITVMPLVNAWGFGPAEPTDPDRDEVDSIRTFVGFNKVHITRDSVVKTDPRVQLDFGGIGQGYGADIIADFLRSMKIHDFLVELGGEGLASGKNLKTKNSWRVGILDPRSTLDNQFFKAYVSVVDRSFTTAGNYFNYREIDGKKFSHTIDPSTGYPADQRILSASVFAVDCMTADAWDTAFLVMGHDQAIEMLRRHPEIDALLLYSGDDGSILSYTTPGLKPFIKIEP